MGNYACQRTLTIVSITIIEFGLYHSYIWYSFPSSLLLTPSLPPSYWSLVLLHGIYIDAVLIGKASGQHPATQFIRSGDTSTELCLPAESGRDSHVCESDTKGTIRLINNSVITVADPYVTSITITDDEGECREMEWERLQVNIFFSCSYAWYVQSVFLYLSGG